MVSLLEEQPNSDGKIIKDTLVDIPPSTDPSITSATLIRREYDLDVEVNTLMTIGSMNFTLQGIHIYIPDPREPSALKNYLRNDVFLSGMVIPPGSQMQQTSSTIASSNIKKVEERGMSSEWSDVKL